MIDERLQKLGRKSQGARIRIDLVGLVYQEEGKRVGIPDGIFGED